MLVYRKYVWQWRDEAKKKHTNRNKHQKMNTNDNGLTIKPFLYHFIHPLRSFDVNWKLNIHKHHNDVADSSRFYFGKSNEKFKSI